MAHTRQLTHDPFQWLSDQAGDLLGGGTGVLHKDIHHRHGDLRIFLPRGEHQAQQADGQEGHHQ